MKQGDDSTKVPLRQNVNQVLGKRPCSTTASRIKRLKEKEEETNASGWRDIGKGCEIGFWPRALDKECHDLTMQALLREVKWKKSEVIMFGKPVLQPREICYMADSSSLAYKYSGLEMTVEPWHEAVVPLKDMAEARTGEKFNSCLLNLYRDGKDYMGWHSDDEVQYGKGATICSVSLGHERDFQLRSKSDHGAKLVFRLGQGDIFVMRGATQLFWQHAVPKRAKVIQPRINLTFRRVVYPLKSSS